MTRISLDGAWQFKEFYGEDWRWRDAHKPDSPDRRGWRVGSVPGSVHHDLWQLGEISNPYFERNSLLIEWIPDRTWIYKRTFFAEESLRDRRVRLHFEGIDTSAEIFLNGESLGRHEGMFMPVEFDVSERLKLGADNLIAVVIDPAPHEQPQVSRSNLVRTHKSRMNYWWDFCPRMIHVGLWDSVWLDVTSKRAIDDIFVRPTLNDDFTHAEVLVEVQFYADPAEALKLRGDVGKPVEVLARPIDVNVRLRCGDAVVVNHQFRQRLKWGQSTATVTLSLDAPKLWWPNGAGDQPLYEAEVVLYGLDGTPLDQRVVRFGIRKIELAPNEGAEAGALPYTFVVNGRKLYVNGWNWVPMDVLYGVPRPEKLDRLLTLAQRAHVNLLRVWGGGLIEKQAFYNRCDELGILVWQEFIQSSSGIANDPPRDADFIALMTREAEQIIPRRRNHPSLALWCGGNELQGGEPEVPLDDAHPLLSALKAVVNRLDPDRLWLATSPTGRVFMNSLENIERDPAGLHDVHGPWEYQGVTGQYALYNQGTSLLHSEFGVEGITNQRALDATIAPEHQSPVSLDNPLWQHLGAWWVKERIWRETFGEVTDVQTLRRATQMMQADGLRYALEADRRRQWHNSGTLPWQFNEPHPMAACTSAVDYFARPKPAYYAVASAYEPLHVSAKFPTAAWRGYGEFRAEIWVSNADDTTPEGVQLEMRLLGLSEGIARWIGPVSLPANGSAPISSILWPLDEIPGEVFFLALRLIDADGHTLSSNRYAFTCADNLAPLLAAPPTELVVRSDEQGDTWTLTVTNAGYHTALFVQVDDALPLDTKGGAFIDNGYFCLFPRESTQLTVEWHNVPPDIRAVTVGGWNTNTNALTPSSRSSLRSDYGRPKDADPLSPSPSGRGEKEIL